MSRDSGQHVHHDRRRHGRGAGGGPRGRGGGGGREEEAGAELHGEAGAAQQAAAGAGRGGGQPRPPPHTPTLLSTLQVTGGAVYRGHTSLNSSESLPVSTFVVCNDVVWAHQIYETVTVIPQSNHETDHQEVSSSVSYRGSAASVGRAAH